MTLAVSLFMAEWPVGSKFSVHAQEDYGAEGGYGGEGEGEGYGEDPYGGGNPYGGMGGMGDGPTRYGDGDPYGGPGGPDGPSAYSAPPEQLDSISAVNEFLSNEEHASKATVLGYFSEDEKYQEEKEKFIGLADEMPGFRFGYVSSNELMKEMRYNGAAVMLYKPKTYVDTKYDKPKARYGSKSLHTVSLKKFIQEKFAPLVGAFNPDTADAYGVISETKPLFTLFSAYTQDKDAKMYKYFASRLRKIANDFQGNLVFTTADPDDFRPDDYDMVLTKNTHVGVGIRKGNTYYTMPDQPTDKLDFAAVRAWVGDFVAGKVQGKVVEAPAEPLPPSDTGGYDADTPVTVVTADNYEEQVANSGKDTLIEFYAPWCGHCKSLKPEFESAAETMKQQGMDTKQLAAVDATENEALAKEFDVQGYPTLFFLPGGDKSKKISYEGERTASEIVAYMQSS